VKPYSGGIRHDYKNASPATPAARGRRWSWFAVGLALPVLTVSLLLVSEPNLSKIPNSVDIPSGATMQQFPLPMPKVREAVREITDLSADRSFGLRPVGAYTSVIDLLVKPGDSLEILFRRNKLSLSDLAAMVSLDEAGQHLRLLRPGNEIQIAHRGERVISLVRELNEIDLLTITKTDSRFEATIIARDVSIRTVGAHGVIRSSLFEAGVEAGISDVVTMNMAGIFQWDIDFIQDVRGGDEFTVIHEELWRDGIKLRNGAIVATEFINRGKSFRAARYQDASGRSDYYTPQGRSVRKAFIRAPVDFTRISSRFNPNRRHPVLNTIRAHRGVDYAAPSGTPIKAAGDGKLIFRGVDGGYGNAVIIQHGGNITTLYGHMSRFARARVGSRVAQSDIIGYVGQSGLATGPHLHYEYRVGGVHRNPSTVTLPAADPVAPEYQGDFQSATAKLWKQLDLYQLTHLASAAAN